MVPGDAADRKLAQASALLVAATWGLVVFGASVRVHGAGLACPDWPACFGAVVPFAFFDAKVFFEFGHRVYAGAVTLSYLGLFVLAARRGLLSPSLRRAFVIGFAVLAPQIVLGGLTVRHLLAEWTVASHLVVGNAFAAVVCWIALESRGARRARGEIPWLARPLSAILAALVAIQLVLGGLVSASHAGLACGTWPACNGIDWFPTLRGLVGLQVLHRLCAYAVLSAAIALAVAMVRSALRKPALAVVVVAVVQACLGVSNVWLRLPVEVTLLHTGGAALLVLATTWLNHSAWTASSSEKPADLELDLLPEMR